MSDQYNKNNFLVVFSTIRTIESNKNFPVEPVCSFVVPPNVVVTSGVFSAVCSFSLLYCHNIVYCTNHFTHLYIKMTHPFLILNNKSASSIKQLIILLIIIMNVLSCCIVHIMLLANHLLMVMVTWVVLIK